MNIPGTTRIRLEKAAADTGFDLERPGGGGWLAFASSHAPVEVWLGIDAEERPAVALSRADVAAALVPQLAQPSPITPPPGAAAVVSASDVPDVVPLLRRAFQLARTLPNALLREYQEKTAAMPRATEAERLVVQRVGQDVFRAGLMEYWEGRCAVTGLAVPELLRASHIKPWADCETDAERLDVFNGLLLAAHLDAAFDSGLMTVDDEGCMVVSDRLDAEARGVLGLEAPLRVNRLDPAHRPYLKWHRDRVFAGNAGPPPPGPGLVSRYGKRAARSEDATDLVSAFPVSAFASPRRSTVPLLTLWAAASKRDAVLRAVGIPDPTTAEAFFEYRVDWKCSRCATPARKARDSHTDVMVIDGARAIAVEAKYTEGLYADVNSWLSAGKGSDNRHRVLEHWLHLLSPRTETEVRPEEVGDLVYQMVHRTASACEAASGGREPVVVHLLFSPAHAGDYVVAVRRLADRLDPKGKIRFVIAVLPVDESPDVPRLYNSYTSEGESAADAVVESLSGGEALYAFGKLEIIEVRGGAR